MPETAAQGLAPRARPTCNYSNTRVRVIGTNKVVAVPQALARMSWSICTLDVGKRHGAGRRHGALAHMSLTRGG
jgi:hypothetical protein